MRSILHVVLAGLLLASAHVAGASPEVAITPPEARPGEVLFATLVPEGELLRAACSWRGRSYPFLGDAPGYSVILPVPAGARPGSYRATVYWKYSDGRAGTIKRSVEVRPRRFGVQRLRLSRSQERQYSAPETEREYELIGSALDLVSPERHWRGSFILPVQGRISTQYGLERWVNGRFSYRHRGVDIAAPEGTAVAAAADGVVSLADDSFQLHGQTVVVDHGHGVSTLYLHLSRIEVSPGERVAQGQTIGRVGSSGVATGPHLHFAVYAYHEAVDPLFWTRLPR